MLAIPDLGAGQNTVFRYDINTSKIAPPLNFTSNYSDSRIFAGLPVTITDSISNELNSSLYPTNCIYNINVVENAMSFDSGDGIIQNITFVNNSQSGPDSSNTSISAQNRTLTWNVLAGGCLNSASSTHINYQATTPQNTYQANSYQIINSTTSYNLNDSFSRIDVVSINSLLDVNIDFQKFINSTLTGDNASWGVNSFVSSSSDVDINLTSVSLWVSVRNATGTGFTNPSTIYVDTLSGSTLQTIYTPNILLNSTTGGWNNSAAAWFFNYTYTSASPIVWMDLNNTIINDGLQLANRSFSYGENQIYIKELYIATGYFLQITRNITRLSDSNYNVFIEVVNLGSSPTPSSQAVQVYNFVPNSFNLTSPFVFSSSSWYTTSSANETLNDPTYNGTMFQFAIMQNNSIQASLDAYGGSQNQNNTWNVTYNLTGQGQFNFDDLFLTGVDPLNVGEYGATQAITLEGAYNFLSSKVEYVLGGVAVLGALLALLI